MWGSTYESLAVQHAALKYFSESSWRVNVHAVRVCQPHCIWLHLPGWGGGLSSASHVELPLLYFSMVNGALFHHHGSSAVRSACRETHGCWPTIITSLPSAPSCSSKKAGPKACAIGRGCLHCDCGLLSGVVPKVRSPAERNQWGILWFEVFFFLAI